jgi:hypothetical protein
LRMAGSQHMTVRAHDLQRRIVHGPF